MIDTRPDQDTRDSLGPRRVMLISSEGLPSETCGPLTGSLLLKVAQPLNVIPLRTTLSAHGPLEGATLKPYPKHGRGEGQGPGASGRPLPLSRRDECGLAQGVPDGGCASGRVMREEEPGAWLTEWTGDGREQRGQARPHVFLPQ